MIYLLLMAIKNKGGRPRRSRQKSDHFFQVRLTADEYATLKGMAAYQGKGTAGEFLRSLINQAQERGNNAAGAAGIWEKGAHERPT